MKRSHADKHEGMVLLCLWIRVASARRPDLIAFLREAIPVYERPGGIRVLLLERVGVPEELCEIIEYASRERYEADQERAEKDFEMKALIGRWRTILDGPPVVEVYVHAGPGRG
jgi:hypothetical protein